jgi:3-(3-hydroxy-phenyl)propionate hydroxylase
MSSFSADYDVAIVGFGPTGALAANFLGRQGHRVLVLEKETGIYPLPRAIHIDAEIMRVYQAAGLAEQIAPSLVAANECQFVTARRRLLFREVSDPTREPYGWPQRLLFRQPELEAQLREGVARYPNVTVQLGQQVMCYAQDETGVTLTVQGAEIDPTQVRARYVLGCDGAWSMMRRLSGIQYRQMAEFKQPWLVVDTFIGSEDAPLPKVMTQVCDPVRPTTFIPRTGTLERRWEFFMLEGESWEEMQQPERIRELLRPWIDPDRVTIERAAVYTFRAMIADRWRDRRLFLLGDAAHLMPPFMGQGLCSGARDAHNITWKLDLVLRGLADPAVLDTYEQERSPHVQVVTLMAVIAGKVIMERRPTLHQLRDHSLTRLSKSRLLNRELPLPGLFSGLLLRGTPAAGARFIQPRVTVQGEPAPVRLDDVLGDGFAILAMNSDPRVQLEVGVADYWQHLGARFIHVLPAGQAFPADVPDGLQIIRDDTGELSAWFARHRRTAVVVRPDRYVFGTLDAKTPVTRTLGNALRPTPNNIVQHRTIVKPEWLVGAALATVALAVYRASNQKRKR